ncbi:MAG: hypothetical protein OSA99_04080 [Acidimicrobiales bacterium]|nr:hypothetical protein [Acidimicrobiales bacterium]
MESSGGTSGRAARRGSIALRTVPVFLAALLAGLLLAIVDLRADTDRARAAVDKGRVDLAEGDERIDDLHAERRRLTDRRIEAARALDAALARLESLVDDEARLQRLLTDEGERHDAAVHTLDVVAADVDEAADQSAANDALLAALDRCLDGATEAANALSVGDVTRAFARAASVRADCSTVGVAIG